MSFESDGLPDRSQQTSADEVDATSWWSYSCVVARGLREGKPPPVVEVYGPLLQPGEEGRLSANMMYGRYYGGSGSYTRNNLFAFGSIPFMIGAYGVNELMNQSRKDAALRESAVQWRDVQMTQVIVTSDRLLCSTHRGWLSFWFAGVTEFYPDLENWSVTLCFGDTSPLKLSGAPAPAVALLTAHAVLGPRWLNDPRLDRLR
jgi:hypothetical protein